MTSVAFPSSLPGGPTRRGRTETDVISTIGGTPLIALDRLFDPDRFQVYGKCERFNPGGSIKDRSARSMIEQALKTGAIVPGRSTVVESTSGNLGVALAQLCNFYRVGLICVIDPKTTAQNAAIMRAYGARLELVDQPDPQTGEYLPTRLGRVRELLASVPDAYWLNQYANERNSQAHHTTMREIHEALPDRLDYLFCTAGTCGTLRGCAEFVRDHQLDVTIVAVDAVNSAIFGPPAPWERSHRRLIPGHGAAMVPPLLRAGLADRLIKVTDADCVRACRELLAQESVLAGGSSGAAIAALQSAAEWIEPGAVCVAILPDGGDRYLNTIYSDRWVREHIELSDSGRDMR
ncbi:2,3-diaminopropionate biosynthesis protein SbnA [Micromonospora rifamycinica]|uniref:2,3-diaminopropionate biosynthesis protein SbnA n=1 Tax=Micromonospora rifamycinica TaxID=291594 RepID=UPI00341C0C0C